MAPKPPPARPRPCVNSPNRRTRSRPASCSRTWCWPTKTMSRVLPVEFPAPDHPVRHLRHPRGRTPARRPGRRPGRPVPRHQRHLVLGVRRPHDRVRLRYRHRPRRPVEGSLALRGVRVVDARTPRLRQRPDRLAADCGVGRQQPVEGRQGSGELEAAAAVVPLHLQPGLDQREGHLPAHHQPAEAAALAEMLDTCATCPHQAAYRASRPPVPGRPPDAHRAPPVCAEPAAPHPAGATAECKDGTPSYSKTFRGTCSGHGGVRYWFK